MKKILLPLLLLFAITMQAQQMSPVSVDPDVRIGTLPNGLKYYIRYNNWPEHRANFYIAQKVGSIQEEESQRGLAHFLEHMCFNGTDHFKGNDLIRYCETLGVQFGGDLNAYTSLDQTVYNISNVPTHRQSALDSCLLILRDWADGLTLDPKEIDEERGVIHEEWRSRTSASSRMFERNLPILYPNSKYGVRYPIGLMSVVDNFKYKELRDYYEKWYHPSNQGIIVVGDVDVDHIEAEIKRLFSPMKNPENMAAVKDEPVPDTAEPIIIIDKDKEYPNTVVEVIFKHDVWPDSMKQTMDYVINNYIRNISLGMLNIRLAEKAQVNKSPFVGASVSDGSYVFAKTKGAFTLTVAPKDMAQAATALTDALTETYRAADHGFTATEYERMKVNMLSALDKAYSNKDKRTHADFAEDYKGNFLSNEPIPAFEDYYKQMKQIIPQIPLDQINTFIKQLLAHRTDSNMVILNFNNEKEGSVYPTKTDLLDAVHIARVSKTEPYVDNVKNEPLIAKMPKAGKIKKETYNTKFDYKELKLSNGVTVVLKQTDFKKDHVSLSGSGYGGRSLYGEQDYINLKVFNRVIGASGLGKFSNMELGKALAGKIASASFSMGDKYMGVGGSATSKDVETMLQLIYLYFTQINKDQKSFDNLINAWKINLKNRDLSPDVAMGDSVTATAYGHNPRLKPFVLADLEHIDYDRILEIARERTAHAASWTFTIIGNFDEATLRPLICRYLASLPVKGKLQKGKLVKTFQRGKVENVFYRKMETPKAAANMFWHTTEIPYTIDNAIKANMVGQILSMVYLKKIREEAGAAYSCGAEGGATIEDDYHDVSIFASCPMKPEKKDLALKIMTEEVHNMAETCDPAMLEKVKQYMLKNADQAVKTNGYWLGVINMYRRNGIDAHTDYKRLIESQTPQGLSDFVKKILKSGNHISVVMLPQE